MKLTPDELRMLDGTEGAARQKAMELLVRYAEAVSYTHLTLPTILLV